MKIKQTLHRIQWQAVYCISMLVSASKFVAINYRVSLSFSPSCDKLAYVKCHHGISGNTTTQCTH